MKKILFIRNFGKNYNYKFACNASVINLDFARKKLSSTSILDQYLYRSLDLREGVETINRGFLHPNFIVFNKQKNEDDNTSQKDNPSNDNKLRPEKAEEVESKQQNNDEKVDTTFRGQEAPHDEEPKDRGGNSRGNKNDSWKIALASATFGSVLSAIIGQIWRNNDKKEQENEKKEERIKGITVELDLFVTGFSANNVTPKEKRKNNDLLKKIKNTIDQCKSDYEYYFESKADVQEVANYLYSLHALSSYYMESEHNGVKARELLEHGKNLLEKYTSLPENSILKLEKIYTTINEYNELPQIYTRIIYSLGRTYIYQGDRNEAEKYFSLSKELGKEMELYEAFLSDRSGIGVLKYDKAKSYMKDKDFVKAKKELEEIIRLYSDLKEDDNEYVMDYKPNCQGNQTTNVPKSDVYNKIRCSEQIIKCATDLINITFVTPQQKEHIEQYTNEILGQVLGEDGILNLSKSKEIRAKKAASIFNVIGNALLTIYDAKSDFQRLKPEIEKSLNLPNQTNGLQLMEEIFKFALDKTGADKYTKADAYDGLMRVCKKKIESGKYKAIESNLLLCMINFWCERDKINKDMQRNEKYKEDQAVKDLLENNGITNWSCDNSDYYSLENLLKCCNSEEPNVVNTIGDTAIPPISDI
jgi:hypothetical protein